MKKNMIALIAGAAALCIMAAGCGSQTTGTAGSAAASTASTADAAATTAAAEETPAWQEDDTAYLSGIKASDYVELPDGYKHQEVEVAKPVDPTDEEVKDRMNLLVKNNGGALEEVSRSVQKGDTVSIDYVGKIDGKEFEGGTGSYDLQIGSGAFIEGFEDGLIGAKKGETLDLNLKFPDDYPAEDVAGKDVVFTVTVKKVSADNLTDDFVKSLNLTNEFGQAVTDIDSFREYIRSNMIEENEQRYIWLIKRQIDDNLLATCTFKQDIPQPMQDSYYFQYNNYLNNAASSNYMPIETYMQKQYGATEDNYEQMIRDFATQGAQLSVIYQAIADERDLNPTEEEINTAISKYAEGSSTEIKVEDMDRYLKEYIRDELLSNRVRDWLYENCKVTEPDEEKPADEASTSGTKEASASDTADTSEDSSSDRSASSDTADSADTDSTSENSNENASNGNTEDTAAMHEN